MKRDQKKNFGRATTLVVDGSPTLWTYLRFVVPNDPAPILSAELRLFSVDGSPDGGTVSRVASTTWSETSITWNNRPAAGAAIGPVGAVPAGGTVSIDLSSHVTAPGAYSLVIATQHADSSGYVSREGTNVGRRPALVLTQGQPPPVVAVAGDIACDPNDPNFNGGAGVGWTCDQRATSEILVSRTWDAVLTPGDHQYSDAQLWKFQQVYDPTWGRLKSITYPAPGNHEYYTAQATGYFDYFGAAAGPRDRGYYSFDIGEWHVIALNSNCGDIGGCGPTSPQVQWLRADLAVNPAECTAAYWHHPRWSSGNGYGNDPRTQAFWDALHEFDADLVLNGHAHNYERFAPLSPAGALDPARGIRQIIVGTGGASLASFVSPLSTGSEVRGSAHGLLSLTLKAGGYEFRFLPSPDETFTDSGSGTCH